MEMFDPRRPGAIPHAGTFNNNTLTMAAATAAVDRLLSAAALDQLNTRGDRLRESMLALFQTTGAPFTVTGLGSLMNIHPVASRATADQFRKLLFLELTGEGIYIAARGLIALSLAITDTDIECLLQALERVLARHGALFPG